MIRRDNIPAVPPPDPSPMLAAERIAHLVEEMGRRMMAHLEAQVAELDLTPQQAALIGHLDAPLPMKEVAGRLHCDASNVTGLVDRLESRGLVERRVRPADRRVKELVLTDDGRRVRRRVIGIADQLSGFGLSDDEQEALIRLLGKAVETLPPA
jgi:DNA-binding MarR family transcriptional regulator